MPVPSTPTVNDNVKANTRIIDGSEAVASVAYRCNDIIGIYPITPASVMAELCDEWSAAGQPNFRGSVPTIFEMQSEGGAAGLLHGALTAGALATSFTSSQGLLLMLPNMYKIAGELTPFVLHVATRTVATHALSIFCEHSDVMAARQTGFALLAAGSVQQAHDFALIAQAATLKSRVPFVHFFDGFRTSHEINHVKCLDDETLRSMLNPHLINENYRRRLTPDSPSLRGSSQNPDTYFQAREAVNRFYDICPDTVEEVMEQFADLTGREYKPFEYYGDEDATDLMVLMGSATSTVKTAIDALNRHGQKVGLLSVNLYRPFSVRHCLREIPASIIRIAVLDRCKEAGATGEPLYLDMVSAINQGWKNTHGTGLPQVFGGRYGLSAKEFTPKHAEAVFAQMQSQHLEHNFTVGIIDDVTHLSVPMPATSVICDPIKLSAMFFGLGSDGTVGANKNTIKIIGENSDLYGQGYFLYDSKKSGAMTTSHLRFDTKSIDEPYLIEQADFIGCHQFSLLHHNDVLQYAKQGATLLFNSPYNKDEVWQHLSYQDQQQIIDKEMTVYTIDATKVANECGIRGRINNIMQRAFFLLTGIIDNSLALKEQKQAVFTTYNRKGQAVVDANYAAIEATPNALQQVEITPDNRVPDTVLPIVSAKAPEFVKNVTAQLMQHKGDYLPVSAFPVDGAWPTGTSKWEKRDIATSIPVWIEENCTQCNICSVVCPHSAIRTKVIHHEHSFDDAPASFKAVPYKARDFKGEQYTLQVSPQDCTGCQLCVEMCPPNKKDDTSRHALAMVDRTDISAEQTDNFNYFVDLPELKPIQIQHMDARTSQLLEPLFEFSGACSGCGETPYIKLLTQLYGDHMLIANATGCSSIYGGNLPTTPYSQNPEGQGPAWSNSLFEDNAEFGLGMRMAVDSDRELALQLLEHYKETLPLELYNAIVHFSGDSSVEGISAQRKLIAQLKELYAEHHPLHLHANALIAKSVWIIGGDGWAYDIGYGGLDHVLSCGKNVNIIVLDNQVYANTGGQQSKATPTGAVAKFASQGKKMVGKDLGITSMVNGNAYVATVALGANMNQTMKAIQEAESYQGPSIIIAYASCIAHGIDMAEGIEQQRLLIECGLWPLYRFDPRLKEEGQPALQLDSKPPKHDVEEFSELQNRFFQLSTRDHASYENVLSSLREQVDYKQSLLTHLAEWK
ncbi:pyruvate:ferredoxin (flavodoxin) oxidoreductase [Vibrio albus]|uniref:Pyruvate-flavodoxin oxidoreductase n=1 Tax=Vibrio albus TaxID=2200953 RepID=A0A2U3BCM1_9VIBR|nr:pyruvate:ferredoxin (flavodoxin) oxidoreductase [Vibrio albus]PWI34527.1 pyruvate:ferredoxin (flavodoxin) oxidoreductase [Vibrio albus]